jgi:hypothetical protein
VCTNTQGDNNNCGRCGMACSAEQVCSAGVCVAPCALGSDRCAGTCVNLQNTTTNCGACGVACSGATPLCQRGVCVAALSTRYIRATMPPAAPFINACSLPGTITVLPAADDGALTVPSAFPMRFWTVERVMGALINVSSNGFISLDGFTNSNRAATVPSTLSPNGLVAAYLGNNFNRGGQCITTTGFAPNRQQIFTWNDAFHTAPDDMLTHTTYSIVLNESNVIDIMYDRMDGAAPRFAGVENPTGSLGVPGCADGTSYMCTPTAGSRIRFVPAP